MSTPSTTDTLDTLITSVLTNPSGVRVRGEQRHAGLARADLVSPVDGAVWADVALGARQDATDAVDAAAQALAPWAATSVTDRAAALRRIADALAAAGTSSWAQVITRETGKRLAEAQGELTMSATYFRVFADILEQQASQAFDVVPGVHHVVEAHPVGVVAVLTPWNFPVSIPARKIAPALAAGCSIVFKPSEIAPLSSMILSALLDEHLPEGTVSTVLGSPQDVVDAWLAHDAVRALSFTGSTRVGRLVASAAAPRFLRTVLELGGCAPFVVLPDADPEHAAQTLMIAKFRNNGQSCIAANQVFVAREVADAFLESFVAASSTLRAGDPSDPATGIGPVAPAGDPARLAGLVDDAVAAGARVVVGGTEVPEAGHYVAPTVLVDVPEASTVFRDEIFGPVAAIRTFDTLDEVVAANAASGYGLAAYVCGRDTDAARAVAARLRAGIVGINTGTPNYPGAPFGGVGLSGVGYEGGQAGLDAFRSLRTVAVAGS